MDNIGFVKNIYLFLSLKPAPKCKWTFKRMNI